MSFALTLKGVRRSASANTAVAPTPPFAPASLQHFQALDGVRGLAILAVLLLHFSGLTSNSGWESLIRAICNPGYLGVTLFFVLSGFLITRILVRARASHNYFSTFFLRRALRIFPLYFAYIFLILCIYYPYQHWRMGERYNLDAHFLSYLLYANNLRWELAPDHGLMHLWSLATEEQFYTVWPFIVYWTPRRWLLPLCLLGFLASLGCRVGMMLNGFDDKTIYTLTPCRMDALLIGAAVGLIELDATKRERLIRALGPLTLACLSGIVYLTAVHGLEMITPAVYTWGWSLLSVFFALVVFWAATSGANNRTLNWGWLRWLGKYSYGIYVLHALPLIIVPHHLNLAYRPDRIIALGVSAVATVVLTALSWRFIELPFLRKKQQLTSTA